MIDVFLPKCQAAGMDTGHINALLPKFFAGIADIYRHTNIDRVHFENSLVEICEDLLGHTARHKYFLSESGADAGWDKTVESICNVARMTDVQIDNRERRAYHDVYFPVAENNGNPQEGRRIRTVIHLDAKDSREDEHVVEAADITNLTTMLRQRMGGVVTN